MARSDVVTQLPLDSWFKIMGANPFSSNQLFSNTMFLSNQCGQPWFQSSFVNADRIGRDDLAIAIREAEDEIERELGYHLTPQWTVDERLTYQRPGQPGVFNTWGMNPNYMWKSVEALRGHIISGGFRTKTLIEQAAPVIFSDQDGDGYNETATVISAVTITDTNEIHLYYTSKSGSDGWEIRPISVAISGGFATIQFKSWQITVAQAQEQPDAQPLDADDGANYERVADVYRVWNDPSTQVQMMWEGGGCGVCTACQLSTQTACFHLRDARLGILVPTPATWDATSQEFTQTEFSMCREPDQVRLWYYSGNRDWSLARPYVEMSPYWQYAVAYFAASKLDRDVCGCSNFAEFVYKWKRDALFSSAEAGGMVTTPEFASNRLGTTLGAIYAWRRIHQNGVRVTK
jgi:hypothetical protein